MEKHSPRRTFLGKALVASAGLACISSTSVIRAFEGAQSPFEGYNPYIEEKNDLRNSLFGKEVALKGVIYDTNGKQPVSNALVEIWHLSPNSTKYRHRGKVRTNAKGEYSFITDWPQRAKGSMPRVYFKVSHEGISTFTELLFNDYGAHITGKHWEAHKHLGDAQLFPRTKSFLNETVIKFNISLSIKK
ncbi:MAG: hypothetical protein HKP38_11375 [Croceitalea sp.]|nr:hypothetical protein [Croceitalea sp.]NNL09813.1 hypothetical protein [Croceitalea sp.]